MTISICERCFIRQFRHYASSRLSQPYKSQFFLLKTPQSLTRLSALHTSQVRCSPQPPSSAAAATAAAHLQPATSNSKPRRGIATLPPQQHSSAAPPPSPASSSTSSAAPSSFPTAHKLSRNAAGVGAGALAAPSRAILNPRYSEAGSPWIVDVTPRAAQRLGQLIKLEDDVEFTLRVQVESGGCHGFQYVISTTRTSDIDAEEDTLFAVSHDKIAAVENSRVDLKNLGKGLPKVVMDQQTLELLEGSKIDYTMELIGSEFKVVDNPRATSSCGCGTSFDLKDGDANTPWGF